MRPHADRLVSFHRIDTPRRITIDNVRDRTMAKREHPRARPADKSWRGGKVPGFVLAGPPLENASTFFSGKTFTINAL